MHATLLDALGNAMAELKVLLAICPPEAKQLITTSFREKTEAALQVGLMYANPQQGGKAYHQTKEVFRHAGLNGKDSEKDSVMQRFVFAASQEAAQEAAEAAQLKSQLEKLLQVKELMQKFA